MTYICNERIFHSPLFMYNKTFLILLLYIEVCSPNLYASFGIFCFQIGQFFAVQLVFTHSEELRNRRHFPSMTEICRFSNILQRFTVPRIIDQFGRKSCQKKRKDVCYQRPTSVTVFFKNSFITQLLYAPDVLF